MTAPLIAQAIDVWKRFGRHLALKGLNLALPEGSAYALLGANGAGKTTLTRLLLNILTPTRGAATVLGVETRRLHPGVLARIGYVSESQVLPPRLTTREYLGYLRPFYPTWDRQLEASICTRLELPLDRRIGQLSHGMRVKAALACALPFRPSLLVLDEPFSGLDPLVREEFMAGVLQQAGELTLLVSSHELAEIEHICTHIGFMDSGRMLIEEPMSDLAARLREVRVTLEGTAAVPEHPPREWLQVRAVGNVVSYIDTRYSEDGLKERIRSRLGAVKSIDVQPMSLRAVFTAIARAARAGDMS
jgi:ABC-2 type transport system ATP-binding protein